MSSESKNKSFGSPIDTISAASTPSPSPNSKDRSRPRSSEVWSLNSPQLESSFRSKIDSKSDEENSDRKDLNVAGWCFVKIFIPVSICMLVSVLMVKFVCKAKCKHSTMITYYLPAKEDKSSSYGDQALASMINALVFVGFMAIATFLMVTLFIIRCYKLICAILIFNIIALLFLVTSLTAQQICHEFNIPMDYITIGLFVFNYGVLGVICIFWKGPLILLQTYLVMNSVLVSVKIMEVLPEWTTWTLLIALAIWDLFAVLSPLGPLRLLIETYKRRNEREGEKVSFPPGMLYTTMVWTFIAHFVFTATNIRGKDKRRNKTEMEDKEPYSPKLGLGDFVFYSILVGKASVYSDWNITIGCYVGILVGLGLTLLLLTIFKKALPALPISILFGVLIFIIVKFCVTPFLDQLKLKQIYI